MHTPGDDALPVNTEPADTGPLDPGAVDSDESRVEVEITYDNRQFRLQVRDDGKGIDRAVAADERRGHFGLPGMRERAELVGGRLDVWSEVDAGTEIDLTIPAAKAYAAAIRKDDSATNLAPSPHRAVCAHQCCHIAR